MWHGPKARNQLMEFFCHRMPYMFAANNLIRAKKLIETVWTHTAKGHKQSVVLKMNFDSNALNHSMTGSLFGDATSDNSSTHVPNTNYTQEELMDFFKKSVILEIQKQNQCKLNESIACQYYCNGFFKELFTSYKSMHGYISLAVSTILFFFFRSTSFETIISTSIARKWHNTFKLISDLHLWYNRKCAEYHCVDTKRHEQNTNKYHTQVAGSRRHVYYDRIHTILHKYVHSSTYVACAMWEYFQIYRITFHFFSLFFFLTSARFGSVGFGWFFQIQHFSNTMGLFMCYFICIQRKYCTQYRYRWRLYWHYGDISQLSK